MHRVHHVSLVCVLDHRALILGALLVEILKVLLHVVLLLIDAVAIAHGAL